MDIGRDLRADILSAADRLFYAHGIHAVGVNRLIEESGVAKDSFYRYFRTKENLIAAYLDARHDAGIRNFRRLTDAVADPRQKLRAVFVNLIERLDRSDYRGCAFMMALAEYGHVPAICDIVRSHKEWFRSEIEGICKAIAPEAGELSYQFSLAYEGFVARWTANRDTGDQKALLQTVDLLLGAEPPGEQN